MTCLLTFIVCIFIFPFGHFCLFNLLSTCPWYSLLSYLIIWKTSFNVFAKRSYNSSVEVRMNLGPKCCFAVKTKLSWYVSAQDDLETMISTLFQLNINRNLFITWNFEREKNSWAFIRISVVIIFLFLPI